MYNKLEKYYEDAFTLAGENGSIYAPMSVLERAGHEQKAKLLSKLNLPDLSQATVVDYGVGSWGFGCVFPKLKECKVGIAADISKFAIECSKSKSISDPDLQNKEMYFLTSNGYEIEIPDATVDLFFAGECIEHIEDTEAFLNEVFRILKNNSIAIFTTPNANPYFYKKIGQKWAMGLEHVALMDSATLMQQCQKLFEIELIKGYTSTLTPELDGLIDSSEFAAQLAQLGEDDFHNASGLVIVLRKNENLKKFQPENVKISVVESENTIGLPSHRDLSLFKDANGRMSVGENSHLLVPVPKSVIRCQLILWSHPWSGIVKIETNSIVKLVDLYSPVSGCVRVMLDKSDLAETSFIKLTAQQNTNEKSKSNEVIFFRASFAQLSNVANI